MILAHKIRLAPTPAQEAYFRRACGTARYTWNHALAEWKRRYEAGEKPNARALKAAFNVERREKLPWSYEVHRDCTSQPFADLDVAFRAFFEKRARYPRFKKLGKTKDAFYVSNDKLNLDGAAVRIPVLGWVKMHEELRFDGKVMSARVSRTADHWFIAIQVDVGDLHKPRIADGTVGVDLGVKALAVVSTGEVIDGPKALRRSMRRLRCLGRAHSRKVKNSSNRAKSAMRLARCHERVTNARRDATHKLTTRLCRENAVVVIEDLNVAGMVKNHCLARSVSDASFGEVRRQMTYKSIIYGTRLVVASRWFPSSKTCSSCGAVKTKLSLGEREYVCDLCGVVVDRDLNAALNLQMLGRASPDVMPVDGSALARRCRRVQPARMKQELTDAHVCVSER